ncbi:MAG: hypothetical protein HQL87_12835 [Magnetococcales bacterium]|nr:hypothetical protein [Magnetococcales bacterium]
MPDTGLDHRFVLELSWMPAFAGMTGVGMTRNSLVIPAKAGIQGSDWNGRNDDQGPDTDKKNILSSNHSIVIHSRFRYPYAQSRSLPTIILSVTHIPDEFVNIH